MLSIREYNTAVRDHSRNLFRYVFKCLMDEESTNDILQDCYLSLWNHKNNVDPEKVKNWLFRTAHNMVINYKKRASKNVGIENLKLTASYLNHVETYELKELVDKALDLLPQIQKTIIILRDLEGYRYDEIGEILDLNESQVKVYLFRARQKMKASLKEINKVL